MERSTRQDLSEIRLVADQTELSMDGEAHLELIGTMSDGSRADLSGAAIEYRCSGPVQLESVRDGGLSAVIRAGTHMAGVASVTVKVSGDTVLYDCLPLYVTLSPARPFIHMYHQTLTMKMTMAENTGEVRLTFEQGLEVLRKLDNLTRGIPKIVYLVGWQYNGHDSGYPAWDVVNPRLKRLQDETSRDSLIWLMREARRYHTTVSLHINMLDANPESPLWDTYVREDLLSRNEDGSLRQYKWGYPISYTREWDSGFAQSRIDRLLGLLPIAEAGTVHIDAFHQYVPTLGKDPISPYHGISTEQELVTQKKITRYWRDRGVDITSEFDTRYRMDPLIGLQPMAWHFGGLDPMKIPAQLYCGGEGGDPRFGVSMMGQNLIKKDAQTLKGFLDEFCKTTLLWYYLNRLERKSDMDGVVTFVGSLQEEACCEDASVHSSSVCVTSEIRDGKLLVQQDGVVLRDGDDLFVPALWNDSRNENRHKEIIAYSGEGYQNRRWRLPADWSDVAKVDIYGIGLNGLTPLESGIATEGNHLSLKLLPGQAVSIMLSHGDGHIIS